MVSRIFSLAQQPGPTRKIEVEVEEKPEEKDADTTPWQLILYNDEEHSFDEVIQQLVKALRCSVTHARELTMKVHNEGKATVFEGAFEECLRINSILQEIELITEIKG